MKGRTPPWPAAAAGLMLGACTVGPNFQAPPGPVAPTYSADTPVRTEPGLQTGPADASQAIALGQAPSAQWWRSFGSPELDAMVREALTANPDLRSAEAALRQARESSAAQAGVLAPSLDASYQAQRAKDSAALSPVLANNADLYSLHTAQLEVSYVLDVFGGSRRAVESARAQAESQGFQYQAARSALIANLVAGAVQEAALHSALGAAQAQVQALRDQLDLTRRQADLGAVGQADVAALETTLAQTEQTVAPLQKALAAQRTALGVLLGREPGQGLAASLDLDRLTLPTSLPVALPAQAVRWRPDIRAAEANLHSASAQVGVAIAARLPNLTLSAAGGGASTTLQALVSGGNDFWTLTGGVTQPIFQGGALLHKQKAAEAALDQAKAQYRSTVLVALKNVADTLDALARDAEALRVAETADAAAQRSLTFSRRQMALGQIGALAERSAEQAAAQAQAARVLAAAARYADTAALFQAVGAGPE